MNKSQKCSATQKGRVVISKDDKEKRIYPNELEKYLSEGWSKGASLKHRKNNAAMHKGKPSPHKGKSIPEEQRQQISQTLRNKYAEGIIKIWNKGLTCETDPRVAKLIENSTTTKIERYGSAFPNNNMSIEHKKKIGAANKGKPNPYKGKKRDSIVGKHISEAKMGHEVSQETRDKISRTKTGVRLPKDKLQIKLTKQYLTKKKNNSFNISQPEQELYDILLKENVNKTIYRQYKDKRYPFYCDFYIVEDDLFIELNAHWTHGGKPFDENDPECISKLAEWEQKAKTSKFYQTAIEVWTIRDVQKQQVARENNLNYKVIY